MFRTGLIAATLMTASLTAVPASAEPAYDPSAIYHFSGRQCPDNSLCIYKDIEFNGGGVSFERGDSLPNLNNVRMNDMMSSWSNDSGVTCYWYPHADYQGTAHDMRNRFRVNLPGNENDTASSIRC
ncbi:peptidase inhibitor family I36 protein [Streptomyces sp. NPDC017940]|uniref:peptidase inhibitor family I36 protein n=1 Tax=Streptomyces sp. NPDC017940 TaxID=3365017 RepID=UPI0037B46C70